MPTAPSHIRVNVDIGCESEKNMFHALVGRLENAIENNYPSSCILELYLRVQMFISHPQIYIDSMKRKYGDTYMTKVWEKGCSKISAFRNLLTTEEFAPTLVFCHFRKEMDIVKEEAEAQGYTTSFIRGGDSDAKRKHNIAHSVELAGEGKPVLVICQIIAGNCGLNLQHLTRVIFYTQHWNPAVMDQAMTRSYRYGQTNEVSVYHLIYEEKEMLNIDRCMLAKHSEKREAAMSIMAELEFVYHANFEI
jgi:SNF2 family DNA or RNA helicase